MILSTFEVALLFIVPVVLLWKKIINPKYKLVVLGIVSLVILGIVIIQKWSLEKLGIRADTFTKGIIPYLIFTAIGIVAIFLAAKLLHKTPNAHWRNDAHFWGLFILISALQEFAFRGFLMPTLQNIFTPTLLIILTNACLFALLHIIYPDRRTTLSFAFVAGLGFAGMYMQYPNLILIVIAHSILNFLAVFYSFFTSQNAIPQH